MKTTILALAAAAFFAVADDEPTYTLKVNVGGVWGQSWVESIEKALGRLDGVKSAKVGDRKSIYVVKVVESKVVLPSKLKEVLDGDYDYEGATVELNGTVAKDGDKYVLTARGSNQKFELTSVEDVKKLVDDGKTKLVVTGGLTEGEEKDGKKPLPRIEVTGVKESKKEEKK